MGDVEIGKDEISAMGEAIKNQFHWTTEDIAKELGMSIGAFRVWKQKAEKAKKVIKPAKGSLFCIVNPDKGNQLLYSDAYVEKLREVRGSKPAKQIQVSSMAYAKLKLTVPVFDGTVAQFLLKKFKDQKGVEDYLKNHLIDISKPVLAKLEEAKRRYDQEVAELIGENDG